MVPIIFVGISIQYHWIWTIGWYISANNWCYGVVSDRLSFWNCKYSLEVRISSSGVEKSCSWLKFVHSQPQKSSRIWSSTPEWSGVYRTTLPNQCLLRLATLRFKTIRLSTTFILKKHVVEISTDKVKTCTITCKIFHTCIIIVRQLNCAILNLSCCTIQKAWFPIQF